MIRPLKPLKDLYSNMRLQSKFMITHLVLIIIPTIVIAYFFYGQMYDTIVSETIRQEQNFSKHSSSTINAAMDQINVVSDSILDNAYLNDLLNEKNSFRLLQLLRSPKTEDFYTFTNSMIDGNLITDIKIYMDLPTEDFYEDYNGQKSIFLHSSEVRGSYWNGIFNSTPIPSLFCPKFYLSPKEVENYGSMSYVRKVKSQTSAPEDPSIYVVVYYSQDNMDQLLMQGISENNTVSYIVNERNALVSSSNIALAGTYLMNYETIKDSFMQSNNYITKTVLGKEVYAGFYNVAHTSWYMVSILPAQSLQNKGQLLIIQFVMFYLFFLMVAFIMATTLSRSITKRLGAVINQMKTVRTGRPVSMETAQIHDEVGDLIDTYNYMSTEMNTLMDNQAKSAEDLRIAEFKALQSQINPHFLYNTLDMINWLSLSHQEEKVTEAVQALSKFYKLTLNKGNIAISLKEEITQVSLYVKLQNMRYQDKIEFIIDVPDEMMDYEIPKLVLQPLVENAIMHGIFEKEEKMGTILITGWLEDEVLVLIVSDDGVGISEDKLKIILTGAGESISGSNIGIYNTHERLQLFYNNTDFGLAYSSDEGNGTEVEIKIPAKKIYIQNIPG